MKIIALFLGFFLFLIAGPKASAGCLPGVKGSFLIQQSGQIWYVSAQDGLRYAVKNLGRSTDIIKKKSLSISNNDLLNISLGKKSLSEVDSDLDGFSDADEIVNGYDPSRFQAKLDDSSFSCREISKGKFLGEVAWSVPFAAQAPTGEWQDPRQKDGCEEASVLMAMTWASGQKTLSKEKARQEIIAMSDYQQKKYQVYKDTSAQDTVDRLIKGYFSYAKVATSSQVTTASLRQEIERGNLVILPVDGRKLGNPNFKQPGPERHMLLVFGYNYQKKAFITHEPGTKNGSKYLYPESVLVKAVRDYPSGNHPVVKTEKKVMIVVYKDQDLAMSTRPLVNN